MSNLDSAKKIVVGLFQKSLPPGQSSYTPFSTVEQITMPISNAGVIANNAMQIIDGSFVPGDQENPDGWSTGVNFTTTYLNLIQNLAYGLSVEDQNKITSLTTKNQEALNALVDIYEKTYGRITDDQMSGAGVADKIDYVTSKLPSLQGSLNWAKFQPTYNLAKADMDILGNLNSNQVTFSSQLKAIKLNMGSATAVNGGTQSYDNNNNKVWLPGYNVDQNFPSKFANGQTVDITITISVSEDGGTSFNINGSLGGSFSVGWLGVSGSASSEYSESSFRSLFSNVTIKLTYTNVCFLSASPTTLSLDNARGWYVPQLLKQAYSKSQESTGPFFAQDSSANKKILDCGAANALVGILLSAPPTGSITFATDDYASFEKYFHTQAKASVNLFGFIPLGRSSTSYTKTSSSSGGTSTGMTITINPGADKNNLVVHGAALDSPIV